MNEDYINNVGNKKILKSGIISLEPLYTLLKREVALDCIDSKSITGKYYSKITGQICETIPYERGFYLWGNFNKKCFWTNIYLGKAGEGKITSLRQRIMEELRDEKSFIIKHFHTKDEIDFKSESVFSKRWTEYKSNYQEI